VYALGIYWRIRLRGVESETTTAAMKNAIYIVMLESANFIIGMVGLKEGAMLPCIEFWLLGIAIMGGAD
jgi:hypothetical protein